jgi:hypothetical protein
MEVNQMLRATINSMSEERDKHLIDFIASTVEIMREKMATKEDLLAIKEQMATKKELAAVKDQMATKAELAAVKDQMATALSDVETRLTNKLSHTELNLDNKMTVIRGDIEQVQLRLDSIDHALTGRIESVETEMSRLKSVVYLLVKDKPEMLRLLGRQ